MANDPIPPNVQFTVVPIGNNNFTLTVPESLTPGTSPILTLDSSKAYNRPNGTNTAFVWTCQQWVDDGKDPIVMLINPSQVRWSVPFRVTRTNTFGGTVFHRWKNLSGSSVDLPTISITMNSGTLYPITFFSNNPDIKRIQTTETQLEGEFFNGEANGEPTKKKVTSRNLSKDEKINVFYRFIELTHQPAFTTKGQPNLIFLTYRTLLFPNVFMYLQFMEPLQFNEDATKPFNIEYTIGAVVVKMMPQLDASASHLSSRSLPDVGVGYPATF